MLCCQVLPFGEQMQFIGWIFLILPAPLPFDATNELSDSYLVRKKLEWLCYNTLKVEGRST